MIKILKYVQVYDMDNKEKGIYIVGICTSQDEKPLEYANGSVLFETDHKDGVKCFILNEKDKKWIKQGA